MGLNVAKSGNLWITEGKHVQTPNEGKSDPTGNNPNDKDTIKKRIRKKGITPKRAMAANKDEAEKPQQHQL